MPTPQLILSMTAGAFFAISGYHKLFNPERHKSPVQTLTVHFDRLRISQLTEECRRDNLYSPIN